MVAWDLNFILLMSLYMYTRCFTVYKLHGWRGCNYCAGVCTAEAQVPQRKLQCKPKDGWMSGLARKWVCGCIRSAKCISREPHEQGFASCMILLALRMSLFTGRYWANRGPGTTRRQRNTRRQRREGNTRAFLGTSFMGRKVYFVCVHKGIYEAD